MNKTRKRGQVWVETVIYMLIGLSLIGLVLTYVLPKINEQKDRGAIEQTIVSLSKMDDKINEVIDRGQGNKRIVEFGIRTGELTIDPQNNQIVFSLAGLTKPYSEPGISVPVGRIVVKTTETKTSNSVTLTMDYSKVLAQINFDGGTETRKFTGSATPYQFSIENKGIVMVSGEKRQLIDFIVIS